MGPHDAWGRSPAPSTRSVAALALLLPLVSTTLVTSQPTDSYEAARLTMVEAQIEARGILQPQVLDAMRTVPRHRFVPEQMRASAYGDYPLYIGEGQTISQPYIVALMSEQLGLSDGEKVLEIGTGSGYHAAVVSRIAGQVFSIEIIEPLARRAAKTLAALGYDNVTVRAGDGYRGWPSEAPFDAILLTAAPRKIPPPLIEQLAVGGRLVAPVGRYVQDLVVITKTSEGLERRSVEAVRFVPMTGEAERAPPP